MSATDSKIRKKGPILARPSLGSQTTSEIGIRLPIHDKHRALGQFAPHIAAADQIDGIWRAAFHHPRLAAVSAWDNRPVDAPRNG